MQPTLDIDLMRTLVAYADTGSFTRAAEVVGRTQSAVSMQMRRLEEQIGHPIFIRQGREMQFTEPGRTLLTYARRILRLHQEAVVRIAEPPLSGTLRVGTPDDYANTLLPMLFSRFAEVHPEVAFEIVCESSVELRRRLDRDELDLAILTCSSDEEAARGIVLAREPIVWVSSMDHDAHLRRPVPLALFQAPCQFRDWGTSALERRGIDYRLAYQSANMYALFGAVQAGLAITLVVKASLAPNMRVLGEEDGFPALPVATISLFQSTAGTNRLVSRLTDHLVESFRQAQPLKLAS